MSPAKKDENNITEESEQCVTLQSFLNHRQSTANDLLNSRSVPKYFGLRSSSVFLSNAWCQSCFFFLSLVCQNVLTLTLTPLKVLNLSNTRVHASATKGAAALLVPDIHCLVHRAWKASILSLLSSLPAGVHKIFSAWPNYIFILAFSKRFCSKRLQVIHWSIHWWWWLSCIRSSLGFSVLLGCFDMQPGRAEIQTSDLLDY